MPTTTETLPPSALALRKAIANSGLTTDQLVAKVGCTRRSLSYWRRGQRPSDYYIGRLSKVLGVDLWPHYLAHNSLISVHSGESRLHKPEESPRMTEHRNAREVGGYDVGAMVIPVPLLAAPVSIDRAFRHYAASQLQSLWEYFHVAEEPSSMRTLAAMVTGYQETLHHVAQLAQSEGDAFWVAHMLCEADILAGRIARDQLAFERAIHLHQRALTQACDIGDSTLIAASTMRLAETLLDTGLAYDALGYCLAAEPANSGANPRVRGELLGLTAEVQSTLGNHRESERLIDKAAALSPGAAALPTVGGINFSETAAAEYQATIALRSGNSRTAIAHIQRAHESLAIEFPGLSNVRWKAHLLIDTARIHQQERELERACHALSQAARQASQINSWMAHRKIQETARELGQVYPGERAVVDLRDELVTLSRAASQGIWK